MASPHLKEYPSREHPALPGSKKLYEKLGLQFNKGYLILLCYILFQSFAFSFTALFFRKQGYPLFSLVYLSLAFAIVSALLSIMMNDFSVKKRIPIGFLLSALMAGVLLLNRGVYSFIAVSILAGVHTVFFWVPVNYLSFDHIRKGSAAKNSNENYSNGKSSSWYLMIIGILGIIIPPLGGFVIEYHGYSFLFYIAAAGFLLSGLALYPFLPNIELRTSLKDSVRNFKTLKTITFLEGVVHTLQITVIPLYTLLFLERELSFGVFTGYVALIGLIVGFIVSYFSDKHQKRKTYIYLLFALMSLAIVALSMAKGLTSWLVIVGVYGVISAISSPLRLAISLDAKTVDIGFWKAREIFLNTGRACILLVVIALFYLELYWLVFVIFALLSLLYPFLVHKKLTKLC